MKAMYTLKAIFAVVVLVMTMGFGGCMWDITGRGPAPLERTLVPTQQHLRAGHVYCMRGWLGIFSTGMDTLADKIDKPPVGIPCVSVANEEWGRLKRWLVAEHQKGSIKDPLVLLGHSWGADDQIRVAQYLKDAGITVDLLVLIDPVTPPKVPTNVKRVYCVYKSHPTTDWFPFWRGVPADVEDPRKTPLENINLRTANLGFDTSQVGHVNIEKSDLVHKMVIDEIKKTCLPRSWSGKQGEGITK